MGFNPLQLPRQRTCIHHQVGYDRKIAERLQPHCTSPRDVEHASNTGETFTPLDPHSAAATGSMMTGMPEHQRWILAPCCFKRIQNISILWNSDRECLPIAIPISSRRPPNLKC